MDTEQLIRSLAADHGWTVRRVGLLLAGVLGAALVCSVAIFSLTLHMRPDIHTAMGAPFFLLKFAVTMTLAAASLMVALRLVTPAASVRTLRWLFLLPIGLLVAGIVADLVVPQTSSWSARLIGANARVCLVAIPVLSLPLLIAAIAGLRHGATMRPAATGAVAGLLAGGVAATLYASHCADDSPLFVATWYTIALALVALLGALLGKRFLKF
ncbi:hypothetical protein X566_15910 [Afipia sp. P52-10]|jgi:hypothetical protein|uniref:NrsF family protein n=1 Tax=Afipia sp. P52-10 TaxID=1429916 RepID=UPI0003DF1D3A|nr:DUF1109 domain-containing protein [Afipia sp. P52-10]ETR76063.1 hypothetical protein X566_15910 [Afipia sp. P52-10]